MSQSKPSKPPDSITITIDGRQFTLDERKQTAQDLLMLAGLAPASYDLGELRPGNPEPKRFKDDQQIVLKDGDKFVSIRERAEVA